MFSYEDKVLIKHYRQRFKWGARKIKREFKDKRWNLRGLQYLLKKIDGTGDILRKKGSGRPRTVRTSENIELVEMEILSQEDKPKSHKTQGQIRRLTGISKGSIGRIVKMDLKLKPFKKIRGQKINEKHKEKRVQRARKMLQIFNNDKISRTFFTDEKIFTIDTPLNSQNERVYGPQDTKKNDIANERIVATRSHFPSSVMVSVGVSNLGKTSIFFIERNVKINSEYYVNNLLKNMLPEMKNLAGPDKKFVFQQDGARAHTAKYSIDFLNQEQNLQLLEPDMWPPNSPDLNPLDYGIWGHLSQLVYQGSANFDSIDTLKKKILEVWEAYPQSTIDSVISQFRPRLKKVIEMNGGHIEKFF